MGKQRAAEEFGRLIRELRVARGFSQSELAYQIGVDHSYLSHIEQGRRRPSIGVLRELARVLEVEYEELARMAGLMGSTPLRRGRRRAGPRVELEDLYRLIEDYFAGRPPIRGRYFTPASPPERRAIPIFDKVPAGLFDEANVVYEYDDLEQLVLAEEELNYDPQAFALRVRGDSMVECGILDGDIVVVSPNTPVKDGDIAVVSYEGRETTMKRIFFADDHVVLQPCNSNYKPIVVPKDEKLKILGKVILVRRKLIG